MDNDFIKEIELQSLPRWVCVAFAGRCTRRALSALRVTGYPGEDAVDRLLAVVDDCVRKGTERPDREVSRLVEEIDDLEVAGRGDADQRRRTANGVLMAAKLTACGIVEDARGVARNAWQAYRNAAQACCTGTTDDPDEALVNSGVCYAQMRIDFESLKEWIAQGTWTDETPFEPERFGVMWPTSTPTWARGQSDWDHMK